MYFTNWRGSSEPVFWERRLHTEGNSLPRAPARRQMHVIYISTQAKIYNIAETSCAYYNETNFRNLYVPLRNVFFCEIPLRL